MLIFLIFYKYMNPFLISRTQWILKLWQEWAFCWHNRFMLCKCLRHENLTMIWLRKNSIRSYIQGVTMAVVPLGGCVPCHVNEVGDGNHFLSLSSWVLLVACVLQCARALLLFRQQDSGLIHQLTLIWSLLCQSFICNFKI